MKVCTMPNYNYNVIRCNVLLDRHLTAKLGDFGFTQEVNLVAGRTMITAPAVAKSVGYCPPEKDTCHISPKSDVYVLLWNCKLYSGNSCCYHNYFLLWFFPV